MEPKQALEKVNALRSGIDSVLADQLFGSAEEAVEFLLEDDSPEPTLAKRTLTAGEQRDTDQYLTRLKIQHLLPGGDTCIDDGENAVPTFHKSALDKLADMVVAQLEASVPQLSETFARKISGAAVRPLAKRANVGEREVGPDGKVWIVKRSEDGYIRGYRAAS
jgi:hypothetical protein